jgi:cytochrome c nitrite reductase small subunit
MAVAAVVGCVVGIVGFAVFYSGATSYLGNDPATCANCHVMTEQYEAWSRGPHASFATCNDCHLPHDSVIAKYLVKAEDGVLHGTKFTLGTYPENIRIRQSSRSIANAACVSCHTTLTNDIRHSAEAAGDTVSCVRCHAGVGHS